MTSSHKAEAWWERLPRIIGGWGFAVLVFFKFPQFQFMEKSTTIAWIVYVGLIIFFVGVAHSTVVGIVLGNVTRLYSFVKRGGKERRSIPGVSPVLETHGERRKGKL